jgi:hypothetical protein
MKKTTNKEKKTKIKEYIKKNIILFIAIIIAIVLTAYFKNKVTFITIVCGILTFYLCGFIQYVSHILSHKIQFNKIYETLSDFIDTNIFLKHLSFMKPLFKNTYFYLLNFHKKIHHNSKINKKWLNIITEFYINFFSSGGAFFLTNIWFRFKLIILETEFKFDNAIILLFAFVYSTSHIINYHVLDSIEHKQHHLNTNFNYGPELFDIIFDTKYDDIVVDENHIALNILFFIPIIYFFKLYKL